MFINRHGTIIKTLLCVLVLCFANVSHAIDVSELEPEERFRLLLPYFKKQLNADISIIKKAIEQYSVDTGSPPASLQLLTQNQEYLDGASWSPLNQFGFDYDIEFDRTGEVIVGSLIPSIAQLFDSIRQTDDAVLNELLNNKFTPTKELSPPRIKFSEDNIDDKVADLLVITGSDKATKSRIISYVSPEGESNLATNLLEFYFEVDEVAFVDAVVASGLYDLDDLRFRLTEQQASLNDVKTENIIDKDDEAYEFSLSDEIVLAALSAVEIIAQSGSADSVNVDLVNGSPGINLGQLPAFAVTQLSPGDNVSIDVNAESVDSGVGSVGISLIPDPVFNSVKLINDLDISGDLVVEENVQIDGNKIVRGSALFRQGLVVLGDFDIPSGDVSFDELEANATTYVYTDIVSLPGINFYADENNNDDEIYIRYVNEQGLLINATDQLNLSGKVITFKSRGTGIQNLLLDVVNTSIISDDVKVYGDVDVSDDLVVRGSQEFGDSVDDKLAFRGIIQSTSDDVALKFEGVDRGKEVTPNGKYFIKTEDPISDITLLFEEDNSGSPYKWLGVDVSDTLTLPGDLSLRFSLTQKSSTGINRFSGDVNINDTLLLSKDSSADPSLSIFRADAGQLLAFEGGIPSESFAIYASDNSPNSNNLSGLRGSLALDLANAHLYINTSTSANGGTSWIRLPDDDEAIVQGGNRLRTTMQVGTNDKV
ncbi:hypothetical protein ElyMa_000742400 [Elysia marginata]|uniref:Uncharacterized protein n=1 Tax=Elysia marginata TaxID=1093978 RepID=A0AAV4GNE1_9GAST|nr:hypothetical protein ElyMa_000742400 [Elysia marginata]